MQETSRIETSDGVELRYEALNSVEITESAKGEARISSVKVYHADPSEAARLAVETYRNATELLLGRQK